MSPCRRRPAVLACVLLASSLLAQAPLQLEDGFTFRIRDGRAHIAGFPARSEVTLPLTLGGRPVAGCEEGYIRYATLEPMTFRLQEGDQAFALVDGVLYSRDRKTLIRYPVSRRERAFEVPAGTERIASGAFTGAVALTAVTLPQGLRVIGHEAFARTGLTTLTCPDSLTELGEKAFADTPLASLTLPSGLRELPRGLLLNCRRLTSLRLPSSLERLGDLAFQGCVSLTAVTLPEGLRSIGASAFGDCRSLATVRLPASLASLGREAFAGCAALSALEVAPGNATFQATHGVLFEPGAGTLLRFPPASPLTEYSVPGRITALAAGAFADCGQLKTVTLPPKLVEIGDRAFRRGPTPAPQASGEMALPETLRRIGVEAFAHTGLAGELTLPAAVAELGAYAFFQSRLTGLDASRTALRTLPYGVLEGSQALQGCRLPAGLTEVGEAAFYGCRSLTEVTLPAGVRRVGNRAFAHCASLKGVTLPNGLASIGEAAFAGCTALAEIIFPNTVSDMGAQAFEGCSALIAVGLPRSLTAVRRGTFRNCASLTAVSVPPSVRRLDPTAFAGCPKLEPPPSVAP